MREALATFEERFVFRRSLRIPLTLRVGDALHQISPAGMDSAEAQRLLARFGPLTGMVLASLRDVGLPARNDELAELTALVATDAFPSLQEAPLADEPAPSVRAAMLAWRNVALFAQVCEEVSALASSIEEWQTKGRPRYVDCSLGKAYLQWQTKGSLASILARWGKPEAVQNLVRYPDRAELAPFFVDSEDAGRIDDICRRSRDTAALAFGQLAELATEDVWRTFIRWKHRLTATSPKVVPLWIPRQQDGEREAIDARLERGFGIIDLTRGETAEPELILWSAEREDFAIYLRATQAGIALITLLLDATLRFGLFGVPAVPWFVDEAHALSEQESQALKRLESSNYRLLRLIGGVPAPGGAPADG
jgi:hypothetical protein